MVGVTVSLARNAVQRIGVAIGSGVGERWLDQAARGVKSWVQVSRSDQIGFVADHWWYSRGRGSIDHTACFGWVIRVRVRSVAEVATPNR